MPVVEKIGRRNSIPILYTRGTHYEVGFDVVGQNFSLWSSVTRIISNVFNMQGFRILFWGSEKGFKEGSDYKENFIKKI